MSYVYVIESGEGVCKIGVSSNPEKRIRTIEKSIGITITKKEIFKCENDAYEREKNAHLALQLKSISAEWFFVDFDEAVEVVKKSSDKKPKGKVNDIAKFTPTKPQRDWVDAECNRTGESTATVMRRLIQEKIDAKESK